MDASIEIFFFGAIQRVTVSAQKIQVQAHLDQ